MECKKCGKTLTPGDKFCSACGMPVSSGKYQEKQRGYRDDIESVMGGFDGKYIMAAGILLVVLIIVAGVVKFNYNRNLAGENRETGAITSTYEEWNERMSA